MKLPGEAWLEWSVEPDPLDPTGTVVVQRARFVPSGLWGRAYWYALLPFHGMIFPRLLERLVDAAERTDDQSEEPRRAVPESA